MRRIKKTKEEIISSLPEKLQKENLEKIVKYLKENGVEEIYLFGSLYEGDYNENSDIDIAVKGLEPKLYYHVAGVCALDFDIKCDLIDLNDDTGIVRFLKRYERWVRI